MISSDLVVFSTEPSDFTLTSVFFSMVDLVPAVSVLVVFTFLSMLPLESASTEALVVDSASAAMAAELKARAATVAKIMEEFFIMISFMINCQQALVQLRLYRVAPHCIVALSLQMIHVYETACFLKEYRVLRFLPLC